MNLLESNGIDGVPAGFVELPREIYRDDARWIPEEPAAVAAAFSRTNPWFEGREAIALSIPGRSRCAAFFDPAARIDDEPIAFFGYWESVGDPAADQMVMARVEQWCATRGARRLHGPVNFTTFGTYRLRVEGNDDGDPFPGEPYNPSEYPRYLEALGFAPGVAYVSQLALPGAVTAKAVVRDRVLGQGFRIEPLTHELWLASLPELHRSVDAIFGSNPGYTPPSYALFEVTCGEQFIRRFCPGASGVAYAADGTIAGFLLVMPHYGPITVQRAGTARVPASRLSFNTHYPRLAARGGVTGIAKTGGVRPEYRRLGIMDALVVDGAKRGEAMYDDWIGALIRADNPSRRLGGGAHAGERHYALFSKVLQAPAASTAAT